MMNMNASQNMTDLALNDKTNDDLKMIMTHAETEEDQ